MPLYSKVLLCPTGKSTKTGSMPERTGGRTAALLNGFQDELPRRPISGKSRVMEILRSPARSKLQPLATNSCYICDYSPLELGQKGCLAGPIGVGLGPHGGDCYGELPRMPLLGTWVNRGQDLTRRSEEHTS